MTMFPSSNRPFGGPSLNFGLHTDPMADMRKRHDSLRTIIGLIFGVIVLLAVGSVVANLALAPQQKSGAHDQLMATCAELYPGETCRGTCQSVDTDNNGYV